MRTGRLQIRLDEKLKERADRLAKRKHTTVSALVVRMLSLAIEEDDRDRRAQRVVEAEQV